MSLRAATPDSGLPPRYTPDATPNFTIPTAQAVARPIPNQNHAVFRTKPLIKINLNKFDQGWVLIRLKDLVQEPTYVFTVPRRTHRARNGTSRYIILRTKPVVQIDLRKVVGGYIRVMLKDIIADDDNPLLLEEIRPGLLERAMTRLRGKLQI